MGSVYSYKIAQRSEVIDMQVLLKSADYKNTKVAKNKLYKMKFNTSRLGYK